MTALSTLPSLLSTLTESLNSASNALPNSEALAPSATGISLLDTKNELFLTYLHNLIFLIVLKLRHAKEKLANNGSSAENAGEDLGAFSATVQKLVELRVYLERGVKPLEGRLRYQIDKVVRAADEAAAKPTKELNGSAKPTTKTKSRQIRPTTGSDTSDSDAASSADESESESDLSASAANAPSDLAYRPNLAAFARPTPTEPTSSTKPSSKSQPSSSSEVYRPPKIAPVSLPDPAGRAGSPTRSRRPKRSAAVDEYIASTLSSAPIAEPSIGSTIQRAGRNDQLTMRERAIAADRTRYEEENFTRLPGMSRREKKKLEGDRLRRGQFGGEEWAGLGDGADRVIEVTRKAKGRDGALERSRVRKRERGDDDDAVSGGGFGQAIERKRRRMDARERRKNKA